MSTDGVRAASYLPTDGYLDPSQLTYALAEGAREGGCRIFTHTRVTGIDVEAGRVRGVQTEWGPIEAEVVVNAGGMFAAEIGRMAGVRVPVVPFAHEYLVTQPFRERDDGAPADAARPRPARLLPRGGRRPGHGRLRAPQRAVGAARPTGSTRIAPDFNGILLEEDWDRFEEIAVNSRRRVPAMEDVKVTRLINGPEAFTPDNEFLPGRERGARASSSPPASARTGWPARAGWARRWPSGSWPASRRWTCGRWTSGASARTTARRRYTLKRTREVYETYYDIKYPGHERQAGRPLRVSSAYPWHRDARRGVRREVGLGARELVRVQRARRATRRCARAGGRGGCGRRRSAPSTSPAASARRSSTSPRSPRSRSPGPGAADYLEWLCDNRVARDVGQITYTQMLNAPRRHRVRLHRHARGGGAVLDRHRHRVRQPRPLVDPPQRAGRRLGARERRDRRAGRASGCGARAPATCSRR